jgi:hypothetical protein
MRPAANQTDTKAARAVLGRASEKHLALKRSWAMRDIGGIP